MIKFRNDIFEVVFLFTVKAFENIKAIPHSSL
jgi:hypothetical protein